MLIGMREKDNGKVRTCWGFEPLVEVWVLEEWVWMWSRKCARRAEEGRED